MNDGPLKSLFFSYVSDQDTREFWLLTKHALKKLLFQYQQNLDQFSDFDTRKLAEVFYRLLSNPGKLQLEKDPLFIRELNSEIVLRRCGINLESEEGKLVQQWIEQGLFSYAAFGSSDTPKSMPVIPEKFLDEHNSSLAISELIRQHNLWRLFVGVGKQKEESPLSYHQRQPGALAAMTKSLAFALSTLDQDLDFDILVNIHQACVESVNGVNDLQSQYTHSPYRDNPTTIGFGISMNGNDCNKSMDGYREACLHPGLGIDYSLTSNRVNTTLWGEALKIRVNEILAEYNAKMCLAATREEKLKNIVSTISLIERIHPFWDANCRAICVIALFRELAKQGFPLCVLENPNRFDCFSSHELMQDVIDGFYNYEYLSMHQAFPDEPVYSGEETQACQLLLQELNEIAMVEFNLSSPRNLKFA
ncbi:hypothetical protein CC99x_010245 [Candidatus Berkiella cookevillensis]|uniref:Phosphocholine transferase AnkX n=1 Tax=Candidatus Berkiella cookevillensis TaxID=437022 RepID=A0A0Q9YQ66_9GAMM|nr:hypothetical protein [Candidatus Berkiella cookevillensis]MCS5709284.1 hypothetical protein [Candidatus Berkiella cookevillensis]